MKRPYPSPSRPAFRLAAALAACSGLLAGSSSPVAAQVSPPEAEIDPTLPVKEGFDVERAYIGRQPLFQPLRNPAFVPLDEILDRGDVAEDTPILAFEAGGETLALVTSHMSYHHVAQGEMAGEPWMVTF